MHIDNDGVQVYDNGEPVTLTGTFVGANGVTPTDPTGVTFYIRDPLGVITPVVAGSLTHVSTGVYTYRFAVTKHGLWRWGTVATGAVATVEEAVFYVHRSLLFADS